MNVINLKNPVHFLAFGFGSGLIKPAPGTWGSLAGTIFAIFLWEMTACSACFWLLTVVGFFAGIFICERASNDLGVHDDGRIVWDEILAIWLIFALLPDYNWLNYGLAFLLFRLFDILKPYPIRQFDQKLHGGLGIMFDDILAAIYSLIGLYLISWSF